MKPIRNSAKAVIIRDDYVLLTKNKDDSGYFYLFPGGGQEAGESLVEAVYRECIEEIDQSVVVADLLHIREYIGKNHEFAEWDHEIHQIEFYFHCQLLDGEITIINGANPDSMQVGVEWVKLSDLENYRLYPKALIPILINKQQARIYLGDVN
jgi:8-oxo-dGTP diphosphatase